ncbi:hypothetical protein F5884DRAFT_870123 [Xylogone sp. PMI_703]|nr:hypothetical protein F5884DRAFT_870123 [Xylogone sp. PMI_703]
MSGTATDTGKYTLAWISCDVHSRTGAKACATFLANRLSGLQRPVGILRCIWVSGKLSQQGTYAVKVIVEMKLSMPDLERWDDDATNKIQEICRNNLYAIHASTIIPETLERYVSALKRNIKDSALDTFGNRDSWHEDIFKSLDVLDINFDIKQHKQYSNVDITIAQQYGQVCLNGNPRGSWEAYRQAIELYKNDKAPLKAHDALAKADKGLKKARDWLVKVEGAGAGALPDQGLTGHSKVLDDTSLSSLKHVNNSKILNVYEIEITGSLNCVVTRTQEFVTCPTNMPFQSTEITALCAIRRQE